MKQNNVERIKNKVELLEITNIYALMMIKYPEDFSENMAYNISEILYLNGIRAYMFFDEKFNIDEIVRHIANKNKIKKFCRKKQSFSDDERLNNGDTKNGEIINLNDYFARKIIRK